MLDLTFDYSEYDYADRLKLLQPVATVNLSPSTYTITLGETLDRQNFLKVIEQTCLARPINFNWLTIKQKGQSTFALIQHFKMLMTLDGEQDLTLRLADFCKIHLQQGYAYTVADLYLWLLALLGSKVHLYQAVGADVGFGVADLSRGISPDFQNLLYLLQFWDGDNLYKLEDEANEVDDAA